MKYNPPYGNEDLNASYVAGNPATGLRGLVPAPGAVEAPQREILKVITEAGLTPNHGDNTQLWQAIMQLIANAIGPLDPPPDPDTSGFVTMEQARTRLPIYPNVKLPPYNLNVTSTGAGNIRIPAGLVFQHRGIYEITTALTDLVVAASKTYHLRWNRTSSFYVKALDDVTYNPGATAETNAAFDSTYDDMLIARVVTNGVATPTITNLKNRDRLLTNMAASIATGTGNPAVGGWSFTPHNWARTPEAGISSIISRPVYEDFGAVGFDLDTQIQLASVDRYVVSGSYLIDYCEPAGFGVSCILTA